MGPSNENSYQVWFQLAQWFERRLKCKTLRTTDTIALTSITCSNIPYNLIFTTKFNDFSILIVIISCDYLNLSLENEYVGDATIPT
jgi:hypothetical protein